LGEIAVVASSSPDVLYSVVDAGISGTVIVIATNPDLFVRQSAHMIQCCSCRSCRCCKRDRPTPIFVELHDLIVFMQGDGGIGLSGRLCASGNQN
jgi:hypothetical protein